MTGVEDAVALVAYVQALVQRYRAEHTAAAGHPVLSHENKWQAARHGLDATVLDPVGGTATPVAALIERTLRELVPHARELGSDGALEGIRRVLRDGNGAQRRLAVYAATRDPVAVTRDIAELTPP